MIKKSILIVDDDKANLIMAQELLTQEYRVAVVNSGKLALRYLEKNQPDLILLDIQMPEMDGFEVIKELKGRESTSRIPVIFLTAESETTTEEKGFKLGAVDYITKPFVPAIMQMRVRRTLELESYRKSLESMVQQQLQQITRLQDDIIIMMANLIESRDGTTGEHVKRTSMFAGMLLEKMQKEGIYQEQLTGDFVGYLRKAAPLHDIGKITISDLILQKPGKLTKEEYDLIKYHAKAGGKLIEENMSRMVDKEFVRMAKDMAVHHHEKWGGGGYPDNLSGTDIPLSARILAIVDVFDALIFKRQYKAAMSIEEAMEIMEQERGKSFEPLLLDAFLAMKKELTEVIEKL